MALMDNAINSGQNGTGRVARSADLRTKLQGQPESGKLPAVEPGECGVFRPHSSPTSRADLDMHFAAGVLTATGVWSREALTFVLARSAPRDDVLAADFAYTDELVRRCSTFRQTSGSEPPSTVRLLTVRAVGEKAYATVSSTPVGSGTPPAAGTVALQVLQGTLSIGLSRQAPPASSDNELKTVLEPLLRLARRLVDQPANGSPPAASQPQVPEPPRQAPRQTPEQLARLLQGITGPDGATARILAERYSPTAPARVPVPSVCTYDDAAYLAALDGAATVVAEIPGTQHRPAQISLRLVSIPAASSGPSPFDSRAAALGRCSSIREKLPGGGSRTWAALRRLAVDISGETGYALVYALPDGTGVRHVLVGARKGRLVVETETEAPSDGAVLQAARGLAATINKVMARVGN